MNNKVFLTAAFLTTFCSMTFSHPTFAKDSVDKGSISSGNVQVVARFPHIQPSGIAFLPDNRMIVSFPRSAHDHNGPKLGVYAEEKSRLFRMPLRRSSLFPRLE